LIINTPEQKIAELTAEVASLKAELAIQKGVVAALLKRIYGAKSEKMSHDQLLLEFLGDEAKSPPPPLPKTKDRRLSHQRQRPAPVA
jgi:hypothetical protein